AHRERFERRRVRVHGAEQGGGADPGPAHVYRERRFGHGPRPVRARGPARRPEDAERLAQPPPARALNESGGQLAEREVAVAVRGEPGLDAAGAGAEAQPLCVREPVPTELEAGESAAIVAVEGGEAGVRERFLRRG